MGSTVGGGDVDGQLASGLLDHLQHLELGLQLQAVSALTLHQGGTGSLHPGQPAAEGGQQLRGAGCSSVLHREVDPSTGPVHVHVGGTCQLKNLNFIAHLATVAEAGKRKRGSKYTCLHCKFMHPVTGPDWMGVGINQP